MSRLFGLLALGVFLASAQFGTASAQTLPASAIALAPSDSLTLGNVTITVGSVSCNDGGVGRNTVSCGNLYMVPVSGPDPSVIIEAASGGAGSAIVPIFDCGGSGPACITGGTYDLSATLNVTAANGAQIDGASVSVAGPATTGSLDAYVSGTEGVMASGSPLCGVNGMSVSLVSPSASCQFANQTSLQFKKDFGLSFTNFVTGDTLELASVTETFVPAPEPASVTAVLVGIVGLLVARRKRLRA